MDAYAGIQSAQVHMRVKLIFHIRTACLKILAISQSILDYFS